jgi:hypothetical protein
MSEIPQQQAVQESVQEQSNEEKIGSFARGFLQEIESNEDTEQNGEPEEVQPQAEETEVAEEPEAETPPPEPEEPTVEIELEGKKAKIPEWVKHRVMADKDYRQKTMEVAAERKQLEQLMATATQSAQQAQALAPYHAQLQQMDSHLQFLNQKLQSGELREDPIAENRAMSEMAILMRNRDHLANGIQQETSRLDIQQKSLRAEKLKLEAPKLLQEFPELAKPEIQQKLAQYVQNEGLPQEAIEFMNFSAPGVKLAWKAHQYDVLIAEQAKAKEKLNEKVKGLPAAQTSRAPKGAQDKTLLEKWQKGGGKMNDPAFSELLRQRLRK